jgi:alkylation response protein AidB-like acyl-CoA dehydrogenase
MEVSCMDRFELRQYDFELDPDQELLRDTFRDFFAKESPSSIVRAAEPFGHDPTLWARLLELGVTSMGLSEEVGGDGASLVDLVLVAEQFGAHLAPVPLVSQVVAARLIAVADASSELLRGVVSGDRPVVVAPKPTLDCPQLVPDAALARDVLVFDGDALIVVGQDAAAPHVRNQGSTPLAWFDPTVGDRQNLTTGIAAGLLFAQAIQEWKLLTAAALVGMTEAALGLAVEFSKVRETMGVPIGTLQGVSFPLADVAINVAGARNLVRKAAWMRDHEPGVRPDLVPMAFATAARVVTHGTTVSAHVQGGLGYTVEADASLYFLRAKGWSVLIGDPNQDFRVVGDLLASGEI